MSENIEEGGKKELETILREELVWAEKVCEEMPMDPWINGFRTALRTVLREANRKVSEEESG